MERADGTVEKELRYDLKGNLTEETNALGEKTLYTYDTAGRRTGMWEQAGEDSYRVTVYLYDGAGNVTEERRGYMTNPDNYYLELNSYNRSEGAKLGIRYDDPEPQNKNNLCKKK